MRRSVRSSRWFLVLASGGLLLSGCWARTQTDLDLLLGHGAVGNALRLPYSRIFPLAEVLLGLR